MGQACGNSFLSHQLTFWCLLPFFVYRIPSPQRTLLRLTDYLVNNGLYPATQLTTDDYMGAHTNNTNLAVKAIVGEHPLSTL